MKDYKHRVPPLIVPPELERKKYNCIHCSSTFQIDWFEKQEMPKLSVASEVQQGHWVPVSFKNKCSNCGALNEIVVERNEVRNRMNLYGDEAYRDIEVNNVHYHFFCSSLVAVWLKLQTEIERRIRAIENHVIEISNGVISRFHAKDIMDSRNWKNHVTISQRAHLLQQVCELMTVEGVTKFVAAGCIRSPNQTTKKRLRDEVYSGIVLHSLDKATRSNIGPIYKFDQIELGKESGWAKECMMGIRYYPVFVWLSRGAHVPDIEFVNPLSCLQSKLADCISYITAYEFNQLMQGKKPLLSSSMFGLAHNAGFDGRGDFVAFDTVGFPMKEVFGI